jgi:hypothetical protein
METPIILAYGLETRTWTYHPIYGYGCNECCDGDRCDEDCTAKYKGRRNECPHCKGRGWIRKENVTMNITEFNILCADILGWKKLTKEEQETLLNIRDVSILHPGLIPIYQHDDDEYYLDQLQFHSNWEWIMKVWVKLNQIFSDKGLSEFKEFHSNPHIVRLKEMGLLQGDKQITVEELNNFLNKI